MSIPIGIDLGTTYSAVSWYNDLTNRVETIPVTDSDGSVMRSIVFYPGGGDSPIVGEPAWNAQRFNEDRVVAAVKRSMGVGKFKKDVDGEEKTPPMISSEILKELAERAETELGESISDVVITVPAHFEDAARAATEEAGKLAGLNVIELLSEPQAAALAYAVEEIGEITENYILVYDLGGGTFDVTLVKATSVGEGGGLNLNLDTIILRGARQLGGLDWDNSLANLVMDKLEDEHDIDLREQPEKLVFLKQNCEEAKRQLGKRSSTQVVADEAGHTVDISRAEFDECTENKLMESRGLLQEVLKEAEEKHNLKKDDIEILMVGGSCRMPQVKEMLTEVMGKEPKTHRNPELHVTRGAAYWAHIIQNRGSNGESGGAVVVVETKDEDGNRKQTEVSVGGIVEITTHAVGVEAMRSIDGEMILVNSVVIPEGTKFEEYFTKVYGTSEDDMTEIPISIYKGKEADLNKCVKMGEVRVENLPPKLPAGTEVEVRIGFDHSGIVAGSAKVYLQGGDEKEVSFRVDRGGVEISEA